MSHPAPSATLHPASERMFTRIDWLDSAHSFSFGGHYDPTNTHHGLLLVNNDDRVQPGMGFDTHPHRDMEIVTWVLEGSLVHHDSTGHSGVLYPGLAQRMSAGRGIRHSERNDSWTLDGQPHDQTVHFIQMWVLPDTASIDPSYEQAELNPQQLDGRFAVVASGRPEDRGETAITIHQRDAALHVGRFTVGQSAELPDDAWVHVFVARGSVSVEGVGELRAGDALRLVGGAGQRVSGGHDAEVLVWRMGAEVSR